VQSVHAIALNNHNQLVLLDQRKLPHQADYLILDDYHAIARAITDMVVRGAPAIGITAAYGIAICAARQPNELNNAFTVLAESRPTAVNLFWALKRMQQLADRISGSANFAEQLMAEAKAIHAQDIEFNKAMGDFGASLIQPGSTVYTHCNAGALATGGYGTALGVIRSAFTQGKIKQAYAGETRPWLQGARLTAWELMQENIPVKLSCEGASGQLFRKGEVHWVIVGADRITAAGHVANKIGTYNLAVLARHHGVKFMVAAPSSTFDLTLQHGAEIPIEDRPMHEVTSLNGQQIAPQGCEAINPSFDVTPPELIDAIVCEKGIILPPFNENIRALLGN
jgi:methylthioribose-1-phosphate isomerase